MRKTWNDVLAEAVAMRSLVEESLKLCRAEYPKNKFTELSEKNLAATLLLCEEIILSINEKVVGNG